MKKLVTLFLAALLVFGIATGAMAAQLTTNLGLEFEDEKYSYLPTTWDMEGTAYDKLTGIYLPNYDDPANYRIHSNYTKNTDACAACHATHTAVGAALLQWGNVYEACMACHDGTVSTTYNVKGGYIASTGARTFGGLFGTPGDSSLSRHNVSGGIDIAAAPGGTSEPNSYEVDPVHGNAPAAWTVEFGCQSCHSPHGQGANARILSADPNGQAWEYYNSGKTKGVALVPSSETKAGYNAYKIDTTDATYAPLKFILRGYPYSSKTKLYDDGVAANSADYIFDNTNSVYTVVYIKDTLSGNFTLDYVPALRVTMNISNYLQATESVSHVSGLNNFCGACHTDYNTEDEAIAGITPSEELNGQYSEAYRHKVGFNQAYRVSSFAAKGLNMPLESGNMTCETCHYAHGTNKDFWNATQAVNNAYRPGGVSGDWGDEISGSSALKRLPNMGTCEACHAKGDGNEGYNYGGTPSGAATVSAAAANYEFAIRWADATKTKVAKDADGYELRGSRVCKQCHESYYEEWNKSMHRKKLYIGPKDEKGNWVMDAKARMHWNDDPATIAAAAGLGAPDALSAPGPGYLFDGPGGRPGEDDLRASDTTTWFENNIQFTIGSGIKKQAYVLSKTTFPNGIQNYSPFGAAIGGVKTNYVPMLWVQALNNGYGGWAWKPFTFTWETNCAGCHVTGISKMVVSGNQRQSGYAMRGEAGWETANFVFNEPGIGCENCHGPGQAHSLNPYGNNIINPKKLSKAEQAEACGVCHNNGWGKRQTSSGSMSWDFIGNAGNFYADTVGNVTYNYIPGKSYTDGWMHGANSNNDNKNWYMAMGADANDTNKVKIFMVKMSATPDYVTPRGADNQIDEIGFRSEYAQFIYGGNNDMQALLSCADCHDVHQAATGANRKFGAALRRPASQLCSMCHTGGFMKVTGEETPVDENLVSTVAINNIMANDVQCDLRSYGPRHTFNANPYPQRKVSQALFTGSSTIVNGKSIPVFDETKLGSDPVYSGRANVVAKIPLQP